MNDPTNSIIQEHVRGLSFVDVGGLWGSLNERVTVALEAGCSEATMLDYQMPDSHWWASFHERANQCGWAGRYASVTANLDDPDLLEKVGCFDFVHCNGIIYHAPSPFHTLMQLRTLTRRFLLLGSMTVPETVVGSSGSIDMSDGAAYFIPALRDRNLQIFREHFTSLDVSVHCVVSEEHHPWLFRLGEPNYAPWWWFWTAHTLSRMAEAAGFRLLRIEEAWPLRSHVMLLEAIDV